MKLRKLAASLMLALSCMVGVTTTAVVVTASPATADHLNSCWEVWDYHHSDFFYENGTFSVPTYYGWWQKDFWDVYRECEGHQYGEYLGRYSNQWYRCYC